VARVTVLSTREERICSRRAVVQIQVKRFTPLRLTTTSTSSNALSSICPAAGSQRYSVAVAGSRRTRRIA
jgi:hypothetical protein